MNTTGVYTFLNCPHNTQKKNTSQMTKQCFQKTYVWSQRDMDSFVAAEGEGAFFHKLNNLLKRHCVDSTVENTFFFPLLIGSFARVSFGKKSPGT